MNNEQRAELWAKQDKTKSDWAKLKKVRTPMFRLSFPALFEPKKFKPTDLKSKYSIQMLFAKNIDLSVLNDARKAAMSQKFGENQAKWPKGIRSPFRDGDTKAQWEGYPGHYFISAGSEHKPGVIGYDAASKKPTEILEQSEIYAGCYGRAEIQAFYYEGSTPGISFALLNFQKLKDGSAFSGRKSAEETFNDEFEVDDDGLDVRDNTPEPSALEGGGDDAYGF